MGGTHSDGALRSFSGCLGVGMSVLSRRQKGESETSQLKSSLSFSQERQHFQPSSCIFPRQTCTVCEQEVLLPWLPPLQLHFELSNSKWIFFYSSYYEQKEILRIMYSPYKFFIWSYCLQIVPLKRSATIHVCVVLVQKQGMNLDMLFFKDTLFNRLLIINGHQVLNPAFEKLQYFSRLLCFSINL